WKQRHSHRSDSCLAFSPAVPLGAAVAFDSVIAEHQPAGKSFLIGVDSVAKGGLRRLQEHLPEEQGCTGPSQVQKDLRKEVYWRGRRSTNREHEQGPAGLGRLCNRLLEKGEDSTARITGTQGLQQCCSTWTEKTNTSPTKMPTTNNRICFAMGPQLSEHRVSKNVARRTVN